MKLLSHTPREVASKQNMNSASIVKVAVKVYLMLFQDITPPTNIKMYPDVVYANQYDQQSLNLSSQQPLNCLSVCT